jgi:hypothetical protein
MDRSTVATPVFRAARSCAVLTAALLGCVAGAGAEPARAPAPPTAAEAVAASTASNDDDERSQLSVLVLSVEGLAQASLPPADEADGPGADTEREAGPAEWSPVAAGDTLPPGATIRTGVRAHAVLRVGLNATVRINALSRVSVEQLAFDNAQFADQTTTDPTQGASTTEDDDAQPNPAAATPSSGVLRTLLRLGSGDLDVRVDHLPGLDNDFSIRTPDATLAVRGTNFSIAHDAVGGLRVQGAQTNDLRAIELEFLEEQRSVALSAGGVEGNVRDPALLALAATTSRPNEGVAPGTFVDRIGTPGAVTTGGVSVREPVNIRGGDIISANTTAINEAVAGDRVN